MKRIWEFFWDWYGPTGAGMIALFILCLGVPIGLYAWYDHVHPCIRTGPGTCGGYMYCSLYDTKSGFCMVWVDEPKRPCEVCVERAP